MRDQGFWWPQLCLTVLYWPCILGPLLLIVGGEWCRRSQMGPTIPCLLLIWCGGCSWTPWTPHMMPPGTVWFCVSIGGTYVFPCSPLIHSCIGILNRPIFPYPQSLYLCWVLLWQVEAVVVSGVVIMLMILHGQKSCGMVSSEPVCLLGIFPVATTRYHGSVASVPYLFDCSSLAPMPLKLCNRGDVGNDGNISGCWCWSIQHTTTGCASNGIPAGWIFGVVLLWSCRMGLV